MNHEKRIKDVTVRSVLSSNVYKMIGFRMSSGYTGTFYVSEDNFYLTYQQNTPFGFYENSSRDRFFDVVVPLLPNNIQEQIKVIQNDSSINSTTRWIKISELMQKAYNQMVYFVDMSSRNYLQIHRMCSYIPNSS